MDSIYWSSTWTDWKHRRAIFSSFSTGWLQGNISNQPHGCFQGRCCRVKLTLSASGDMSVTSAPFQPVSQDARYRLAVSPHLVDSGNRFLFHKTTKRALYDSEFERLSREEGVDEVLFLNERYEVVEGSRTNLFVEKDGVLITPPVSCGLLPGCLRRALLEDDAMPTLEAPLTLEDLRAADKIFVGNALRGLIRAELAEAGQPTDAVAETV